MAEIPRVPLPDRPVLLDCGMGSELAWRGVENTEALWSAKALMSAPHVVRQIHIDCIEAGADVIITNTYSVVRSHLAEVGIEDRFRDLALKACALAREARDAAGKDVLIAGSLAPLDHTMNPDVVPPNEVIEPLYRESAEIMAPHVDLFLCETMRSAREAHANARAACSTGKPVWLSWTLRDDGSGLLRSGETVDEAAALIAELPVSAVLANCCWPESVTAALPALVAQPGKIAGGYPNCIAYIPHTGEWDMAGNREEDGLHDGLLPLRGDLGPTAFAVHAERWLAAGARIIGGCCGTGAGHISRLRQLIGGMPPVRRPHRLRHEAAQA